MDFILLEESAANEQCLRMVERKVQAEEKVLRTPRPICLGIRNSARGCPAPQKIFGDFSTLHHNGLLEDISSTPAHDTEVEEDMPKPKPAASGANAIRPQNSRKRTPGKPKLPSKDVVAANLRKTIERRYLRDEDLAKIEDKKTSGNQKLLKDHAKDKKNHEVGERGKKRDRNGKILDRSHTESTTQNGVAANEDAEEDALEREMQALGGTAEDRQLFEDADSESEIEGDAPTDAVKSLDKGMKNILKEIALAQGDAEENDSASDHDEKPSAEKPAVQEVTELVPALAASKTEQLKKGKKTQTQFLCDPKPEWFDVAGPEINKDISVQYTISKDSLEQLHKYAKSLLDEENQKFQNSELSSSSHSFYNTVITSGTLSDKISALTLAAQESPLHSIKALETLIALASKRSRSQAVDVLRALKDLFAQGSLLPQSRKLYTFQAQPALLHLFGETRNWKTGQKLPAGLEQKHLVVWAFESWLKEQYFEVLKILEVWCNDEIEFSKARAVSYVYELLKERPEQESNLLRLLVNKLGDPVKKIASQASYLLMQLLIAHPAMKMVVVSAIESDFIFRPGQSLHGKYYAVVTLNQTAFSAKEEDVAVKLLDIYFGLFTDLLKAGKEPIAPAKVEDEDEIPEGRDRRKKSKKPQLTPGQAQAEELREKLISAILTGVNRAYPYTTSADTSNNAFSNHLDTLFKITHSANFNTSIQSLMLTQQISQASQHKASNDRFYRVLYESLLDPRLIIASKQQLYLNLLHRALKVDLHVNRVKAFVKRIVQVLSLHEPSFIYGACFLLQDLVKTFPSIKSLIDEAEDHDEDDVEVFRDVPEEDEEPGETNDNTPDVIPANETTKGSVYDAHKRDPLHANAATTSLWDMLPFLAHFHPSVNVSAENLLSHRPLSGKPDLNLHTLSHFLDRFVYRNPKLSHSGLRGSSIMQSMATENTNAVLLSATTAKKLSAPVNSEAFRAKNSDQIDAQDVFFHQYFSSLKKSAPMTARERKKAEKRKLRDADEEGSGGGDDEDEIWKAMMQSAPDLEGDDFEDDDEDLDLAELEDDEDGEGEDGMPVDDDDDDVDIDPAFFDDDDEDIMDLDAPTDAALADSTINGEDIPSGADDFAGFDSDEELKPDKKKSKANKKDKAERKRLKALPTFASADDYAKMLEDDEDEDH